MNNRLIIGILALVCTISACVPPGQKTQLKEISVDYKDPVFQQIHNFQDQAMIDSLYTYFQDPNPTYRYLAALAFGSIRDSVALDSLYTLLADDIDQVRAAAAFAIGQTGAVSAEAHLVDAFVQTDTAGQYARANAAILEAVGKCASPDYLKLLATTKTYRPTDTLLLQGQAWGIYRFGLRKITGEEATARMVELTTSPAVPESVRLIGANYLYRIGNIQFQEAEGNLIQAAMNEKAENIRMSLCLALGKLKTDRALAALEQIFAQDGDFRVKCNILRALSNFEYARVKELVKSALKSSNPHVSLGAARFFLENGTPEDATDYWAWGRTDSMAFPAKLTMYAAANRHLPVHFVDQRNTVNFELRNMYKNIVSPYDKATALKSLAEFGWNLNFIQREGAASPDQVVRTASIEALAGISDDPGFDAFFKSSSRSIQRQLGVFFMQAIRSGDAGSVSIAANALRNPAREYRKNLADSVKVLEKALQKLAMPKEVETYNDLEKTIAYFNRLPEPVGQKPGYNHPIKWDILTTLKTLRATIATNKGDIQIELLPDVAPGSVINFVELGKTNFYNDKAFHRVVANFVIQGGCPRGDGYGSLDYTIRSELSPMHYDKEGLVGMASAGNHTEGTQFFITQSPAPHLDGNYTIFARVINGQEAVNRIMPGDRISKITFDE